MVKKYFSEALLITCTNNPYNLFHWLYWHLIIIGFDTVTIIDNNSPIDILKVCQYIGFKNRIKVYKYDNSVTQAELYNIYVNNSEAYWCMPIDDDEYLYISDKYNHNINVLLHEMHKIHDDIFKFSFTWSMMVSNGLLMNRDLKTPYILDFKFNVIPTEVLPVNCVKTIMYTGVKHKYIPDKLVRYKYVNSYDVNYNEKTDIKLHNKDSRYEHMGSVHNPITMLFGKYLHSYNISNDCLTVGFQSDRPLINTDAYLLHFKYRSKAEWIYKSYNRNRFNDLINTFTDYEYKAEYIENIYSKISKYYYNDNVLNLFNKYKESIDRILGELWV